MQARSRASCSERPTRSLIALFCAIVAAIVTAVLAAIAIVTARLMVGNYIAVLAASASVVTQG